MDEKNCWEHFRWVMTMAAMLPVLLRLLVRHYRGGFLRNFMSWLSEIFPRRRLSHIQAALKGVVLDSMAQTI